MVLVMEPGQIRIHLIAELLVQVVDAPVTADVEFPFAVIQTVGYHGPDKHVKDSLAPVGKTGKKS